MHAFAADSVVWIEAAPAVLDVAVAIVAVLHRTLQTYRHAQSAMQRITLTRLGAGRVPPRLAKHPKPHDHCGLLKSTIAHLCTLVFDDSVASVAHRAHLIVPIADVAVGRTLQLAAVGGKPGKWTGVC